MGYVEEMREMIGHRPLILIGAKVIVFNDVGDILLQKRSSGIWDLPGGLMEMDETIEQTAIREVEEETGLKIEDLKLFDVLSGPDYCLLLKNGDQCHFVTTVYYTNRYSGKLMVDGVEGLEVQFNDPYHLPANFNPRFIPLIQKFLER